MMASLIATLTACTPEDKIPTGDPFKTLGNDLRGYEAPKGVAVTNKYQFHWIEQIVSGYSKKHYEIMPAKLSEIKPSTDCKFPKPTVDQAFLNGSVSGSTANSQVFSLNHDMFVKKAKHAVKRIKQGTFASKAVKTPRYIKGIPLVDVVITTADRPVYLVLNSASNVIWNFHIAEGVELAQVVIMSRGLAGVANLDETVPLKILDSNGLKNCKISPRRKAEKHWRFVQNISTQLHSNKNYKNNLKQFKAYNRWFIRQFGFGYETSRVGVHVGSHLVFGSIPQVKQQRISYKTLENAHVKVTPNDYIFKATKEQARGFFKSKLIETIELGTGSKISELN